MMPAFGDLYFLVHNTVNQPVFAINSSGPKSRVFVLDLMSFLKSETAAIHMIFLFCTNFRTFYKNAKPVYDLKVS